MTRDNASIKQTKLSVKLVLVLGVMIISLGAVEVGLRFLGFGGVVLFTPSKVWGFLMTPGQEVSVYGHSIRINSLGFRGSEIQDPKPLDIKRIVFIGDSVTYGGGRIKEEQLFCRIVASLARDEGWNVEVLNLSAPAWSPQNWWAYIKKHGLYEADIVVLVLPETDLARRFTTMSNVGHQSQASSLRVNNILSKFKIIFKHKIGETLDSQPPVIESAQASVASSKPKANALRKAKAKAKAKANALVVKDLRDLIGARPFLAVLIPSGNLPRNRELWPLFEVHLPQALDLRGDLQDQRLFSDSMHLNVEGHQLVGNMIFARLREILH